MSIHVLSIQVFQFGKSESGHFVLDFEAPLTPYTALSIALSLLLS